MARIRTIKPQFFLNEDIASFPPLVRLLFTGLWCLADREGRLEDRPVKIKVQLLPYDEIDIDSALSSLHERRFILRYEIKSEKYIQILNFLKHQQPHYKEVESEIPPPKGHKNSPYITFGVPKEQKERIMERDDHKCVKCGSKKRLSVDHIHPRSAGGSGEDNNLQILCVSCNSSKNNKLAGELLNQRRVNVGSTSGKACTQEGKGTGREGKGIIGKEVLIPVFTHPDWIDPKAWEAYEEMRMEKKKVPTNKARELVVVELEKLKSSGNDPNECLNQSTRNGWTDVYAVKEKNNGLQTSGSGRPGRDVRSVHERNAEANERSRQEVRAYLGVSGRGTGLDRSANKGGDDGKREITSVIDAVSSSPVETSEDS